jgi:hypothetical protein
MTFLAKIARIQPDAKRAAINAGLADNQQALVTIAAASGRKAQLRTVAKLANPSDGQQDPGDAAEADTGGSEAADKPQSQRKRSRAEPNHPETNFEQLEKPWQKELRELWTYAPIEVRERFIKMLRRTRTKAHTDYVQFVRNVFQGRKTVYARELYALAESRGFSKSAVRMVLKGLCYHRKRSGYGSAGRYYFENINHNWKEELPLYSESELRGGQQREVASRSSKTERAEKTQSKEESYDDYLLY